MPRKLVQAAIFAAVIAASAASGAQADGPVSITQAKAMAGGITPGDGPNFPATITLPGSYRLDSNLDVTAGRYGILVTATNVSIDLNGFTINGQNAATIGIYVVAEPDENNVTVRSGTVAGFLKDGINADLSVGLIEGVTVYGNREDGIDVGSFFRIANSIASANPFGWGIRCKAYCQVEGNVVATNGMGINVGFGNIVSNTIQYNKGIGIRAAQAGFGNNTVLGNSNLFGPQVEGVFPLQPNFCDPECVTTEPTGGKAAVGAKNSDRRLGR